MLTMLESLNYTFRNPKNIIWVTYRIKQLRNYKKKHGVLRGTQLGKQRWRARLGIVRVKTLKVTTHRSSNTYSKSHLIFTTCWTLLRVNNIQAPGSHTVLTLKCCSGYCRGKQDYVYSCFLARQRQAQCGPSTFATRPSI